MFFFVFQYPDGFKAEVAEYARLLGQRATSRLFSISQRRVFDWLSPSSLPKSNAIPTSSCSILHSEPEESCTSSTSVRREARERESASATNAAGSSKALSLRSTKQLLDLGVEKEVHEWVKQRFPESVSSTEIRGKAKELYLAKGHQSMKCSYGWYRRWRARFQMTTNPHDDTDPLILTWLLQQYDENQVVSHTNAQSYAQKTLSVIKPEFKASSGWATRFLKRHHVLINWDGIYEDQLPQELEDAVTIFRTRIQEDVLPRYLPERIGLVGCMDEIPLSFSGAYNLEDTCGDFSRNTVSRFKKCSIKNCEVTVLLTLLADGCFLPPFVIMKAQDSKTINQVYSKQDGVVVFYSKSTEPTIKSFHKWLELIWAKAVSPSTTPSLLLLDSYSLHLNLKEKCESLGTSLEFIPLGCSSKLQPLHYLARRHFLKCMDDFWVEHVKEGSSEATVQLPSTDRIVQWITASYMTVREQKIPLSESFQKVQLVLPNSNDKKND